jgi:hypothetical protein
MIKELDNMSREELIRIINTMNSEREIINKVSVCDVEVTSNVESLDNCKRAVNELIKINSKFITLRTNKIKADSWGYFG